MFAAKRNQDITFILHNNSVYALTTGQFSPLAEKGWKGPSTPRGSYEEPFNPMSLMIEAGATFVARGFAFIEVLQPAVPYHKWEEYRKRIEYLENEPKNQMDAIKIAKENHKFILGIFYRTQKPIYHKKLYGDHNPITKKLPKSTRLDKIQKILEKKE